MTDLRTGQAAGAGTGGLSSLAEEAVAPFSDLGTVASYLEPATPERIVAWAVGWFGAGLVLTSSFEDCVLVDMAVRFDSRVEVVFLDTGFHFPETIEYVEAVRKRYDLNLRVVRPSVGTDESPCGTASCCERRKVAPLRKVLALKQAWMTGIRRDETPERSRTPVVGVDARTGIVKVSPLVAWSHGDVARYVRANGLPVHPLAGRGYASIGCAPTTRPVADGEDRRAGRWPGEEKTECGLHA